MNSQELIERDVRMLIGDMHLQLVMARARIQELEQQLSAKEPEHPPMPNGRYAPDEAPGP